jgi:very-short-patch-repair endonuclease
MLRNLLDELDGEEPAEFALEVKTARLLRASPLPPPVRQHPIKIFGRSYRLDFAWPEWHIALECDSRAFHELQFQTDRSRWRRLGATGWRVLPVTWRDVTRDWPAVLGELQAAFAPAA